MNIDFRYDRGKDIWCLLNKGKSSNNSNAPTKAYTQLVSSVGEFPDSDKASVFIDNYLLENNINIDSQILQYSKEWDKISHAFQARAERIFGTTLPEKIMVYLTINQRCPYNFEEDYFFVSLSNTSNIITMIHELWHFYTWYAFGADQINDLGFEKYNNLKEALTVLINVECKDLLPENVVDSGYVQHKNLRKKIIEEWDNDKNIVNLWNHLKNNDFMVD